jgi:CTP:molybdopterin cytidylyltransferase MocA
MSSSRAATVDPGGFEPGRFAGLILAGGEGRRFGGPKAFARLPDGRTFLESCRDLLLAAGARPIAATLPPGIAPVEIAGVRSLPLPEVGLDMLGSARWGLRHLISAPGWRRVVLLPVDHPLVGGDTVRALARQQGPVVVPTTGGRRGHPIVLDRRTAEEVARELVPGNTLRDVVAAVGRVDVSVDDPGIRANCNTPQALREHWRLVVDSRPPSSPARPGER